MLEVRDWTEFIETCLTQAPTRQRILKHITINSPSNWQNVHTPFDIAREMCDLIPHSDDLGYYVFFSNEFLEVLLHERNIHPSKVLYLPDNDSEGRLMKKVYGCDYHVLDKSILQDKHVDLSGIPMKFEKLAVVGNPPYQEMTAQETAQARPVYNLFVEAIINQMNPNYFSFIIPSRWMVGGMGLSKFREWFTKQNISYVKHYPGTTSVFKGVAIQGGVQYFLFEKDKLDQKVTFVDNNLSLERIGSDSLILTDNIGYSVVKKVKGQSLSSKVFSQKPFGIPTNFAEWSKNGLVCYSVKQAVNKIDPQKITDPNNILNKWKVFTSKAASGSFLVEQKAGPLVVFVGKPQEVCTETYLVAGTFDTELESNNYALYLNTKFVRFMLKLGMCSQDINKEKFKFVPDMQDYTKVWTDEELYKHFNLSQEEIDYIESKIK